MMANEPKPCGCLLRMELRDGEHATFGDDTWQYFLSGEAKIVIVHCPRHSEAHVAELEAELRDGCKCICHQFPQHASLQDALEANRFHIEKVAQLEHQLAAERERVIEECAQFVMRVGFSAASYHIRRLAEKPVENPKCKI